MQENNKDRELLELAAKAAGIAIQRSRLDDPIFRDMLLVERRDNDPGQAKGWNPLTDDGDALRLAVNLHFDIQFYWNGCDDQYDTVLIHTHGAKADAEEALGFYLRGGQIDELAATRRAIVRAAAEIGRAMP